MATRHNLREKHQTQGGLGGECQLWLRFRATIWAISTNASGATEITRKDMENKGKSSVKNLLI